MVLPPVLRARRFLRVLFALKNRDAVNSLTSQLQVILAEKKHNSQNDLYTYCGVINATNNDELAMICRRFSLSS